MVVVVVAGMNNLVTGVTQPKRLASTAIPTAFALGRDVT